VSRALLLTGGLAALALSGAALGAQIALYPTGPSQDSAYLRFVNVSASPLELAPEGSKATLKLEAGKAATDFIPVPGGQPVKGSLSRDGKSVPLNVQVAAGDFATVFALSDDAQGIRQLVVNEPFDIPNQLKASLALFNADPSCKEAKVNLAGRDADLFQKAPEGNPKRQEFNPRPALTVQLVCGGANVGAPLELGALEANKRYSLLLVPGASGPHLLSVADAVAN
jgi:alginate O-acetyltransferase complex protein AlgF